jgi:hypothetical protein
MRRAGLLAVTLIAGCGGGTPDAPEERRPGPRPPDGLGFAADLRTADARSPFVPAGDGAWRCATDGRLHLAVSDQGEVAASIGGRTLASVSSARALVNRACDQIEPRDGGGARPARGRLGASVLRCSVPPVVVVDFRGGDVTVRAPGGRFLAAAAVRGDRVGVAVYWGPGCTAA